MRFKLHSGPPGVGTSHAKIRIAALARTPARLVGARRLAAALHAEGTGMRELNNRAACGTLVLSRTPYYAQGFRTSGSLHGRLNLQRHGAPPPRRKQRRPTAGECVSQQRWDGQSGGPSSGNILGSGQQALCVTAAHALRRSSLQPWRGELALCGTRAMGCDIVHLISTS